MTGQPTSGAADPTGNVTGSPGPLAPGTLGRQLLVRVVLIVTGIAVFLSCASVLTTQQVLLRNTDTELKAVVDQLHYGPKADPAQNLQQAGVPPGTLYAVYVDGDPEAIDAGVLTFIDKTPGKHFSQRSQLPPGADDDLATVDSGKRAQTVRVPSLGRYRVFAVDATIVDTGEPARLVVGIPLADADRVLTSTIVVAAALTVLAACAAVIAVATVVRRSLRPLNRVAATAQQVSRLQLDRGEVNLAMRVPNSDTDAISEVGRVGQALNHLLDNVDGALVARQASETKLKRFIADASHELRNPLASIRGYAELTRRHRSELPTDTAFALGRIEAEATRMSAMVEDLLLLARLDSGPDIELGEVDLVELLINAVSDAQAAGPDHEWILDLDPNRTESIMVLGDRYRLHQAVVNLLANARTHTPPGTTVRAGVRVDRSGVMITVADNGPGIPESVRDAVFERFTRADVSRARTAGAAGGSTGLGLAIVAAVVEAHQGSVAVDSIPGRTEFTVRLPPISGPDTPIGT